MVAFQRLLTIEWASCGEGSLAPTCINQIAARWRESVKGAMPSLARDEKCEPRIASSVRPAGLCELAPIDLPQLCAKFRQV